MKFSLGRDTLLLMLAAASLIGCRGKDPEQWTFACQVLQTPSVGSKYILPYGVGANAMVKQGNCSGPGHGHINFWNHGYDFVVDIGTPVRAARSGTVGWARDGCRDGNRACTNLVTVIHEDGTVALYSHLTHGGVLVRSGDFVRAGQLLGASGNTGNTGGLPHLHFSVHACNALPGLPNPGICPTLPINFRNTAANDRGLVPGWTYRAFP